MGAWVPSLPAICLGSPGEPGESCTGFPFPPSLILCSAPGGGPFPLLQQVEALSLHCGCHGSRRDCTSVLVHTPAAPLPHHSHHLHSRAHVSHPLVDTTFESRPSGTCYLPAWWSALGQTASRNRHGGPAVPWNPIAHGQVHGSTTRHLPCRRYHPAHCLTRLTTCQFSTQNQGLLLPGNDSGWDWEIRRALNACPARTLGTFQTQKYKYTCALRSLAREKTTSLRQLHTSLSGMDATVRLRALPRKCRIRTIPPGWLFMERKLSLTCTSSYPADGVRSVGPRPRCTATRPPACRCRCACKPPSHVQRIETRRESGPSALLTYLLDTG